jgi:hypothetical protein
VVVDDFDVPRTLRRPDKAHTPLVVDADAVLAKAVTFERFQPIARWRGKVAKIQDGVQRI